MYKALESAKTKLERLFPPRTDNEFRWLALKAENGSSWTELDADMFLAIAQELENKAELRSSESYKPKDITILPLDHDEDAYCQFKVIVIGPSGVGKTMCEFCLYFPVKCTKDTLEATTKNSMDISSRFMMNGGTLLKVELWDTGKADYIHLILASKTTS
ncbi:hypothetical protein FRC11_012801 [Ceratobasidium sp. 423]|nr:hypothetical protein FRC11_012801 [Ceratobasidium sp. 423]